VRTTIEAVCKLVQFPGFFGIAVAIGLILILWPTAWLFLWPHQELSVLQKLCLNHNFEFEPLGEKGAFEKLLANYMDIAKLVIGLASGSIVLLVGSAAFHSTGHLPTAIASPLFLLALSILYGVLFMVFIMLNYEDYRHKTKGYTRFKYSRNLALGFGCLLCFCVGYLWLIVFVTG